MQPLRDLLVIRIQEKPKTTKSGLFLSEEKWAKPENTAEVLEVGNEVKSVQKGDMVVINPYAVIDTAEKEVKIIKEEDILCHLSQGD